MKLTGTYACAGYREGQRGREWREGLSMTTDGTLLRNDAQRFMECGEMSHRGQTLRSGHH